MRIPITAFPLHDWLREPAQDGLHHGLLLYRWTCLKCKAPYDTNTTYVKPEGGECPNGGPPDAFCTLPTPECPVPALDDLTDDLMLGDTAYWCEPVFGGSRRRAYLGIAAITATVVGEYGDDPDYIDHLELRVVRYEGPRPFAPGRVINRSLDALVKRGTYRAAR